jgi:23S rRNA (adenine2503-C2)-methyltransferase
MTISIFDSAAIESLAKRERLDPHDLRRLRCVFLKQMRGRDAALEAISDSTQRVLGDDECVAFHALRLATLIHSSHDGATKVLFETERNGVPVESVILRNASGRTTLCISSQSGCALRCEFCATGRMGLRGQLNAAEVLDQVVLCGEMLRDGEGRPIRNVVFMGMGEPFDNEEAVRDAVESLISPCAFGIEARRVMVSTVGLPDPIRRFSMRFPHCGLALSLHSARQDVREQIIPVARRFQLPELREALFDSARHATRAPMIEYLMLEGVNDSLDCDAPALLQFVCGLECHINLIPFNPIDHAPRLRATRRDRIEMFAGYLRDAGRIVTIRRSLGADVAAACGQLAQLHDRAHQAEREISTVPIRVS